MRHAPTTDFATTFPPLPPALADLSTPELLKVVLEEVGKGCKLEDFREHAATCHLTEEQVKAHVGAAKRLLLLDRAETAGPPRPLHPWDADPDYRKELIAEGGRIVALGMADTAAIVGALERHGFEPAAMIALWDDIVSDAIRQLHQLPRLTLLAGVIADLDAALDVYDTPGLNAEGRQLARSMHVALDGLRDNQMLPRGHVLATVKAFSEAEEWSGFGSAWCHKVTAACTTLAKLWGL